MKPGWRVGGVAVGLVALGVVTTVVLAWAGPWMMGSTPALSTPESRTYVEGGRAYVFLLTRTWLVTDCWLVELERAPSGSESLREAAAVGRGELPYWCVEPGANRALVVQAGGLPWRAMRRVQRDDGHESMVNPAKDLGFGKDTFLPTRIVWPGLVGDVLVWGAAWGVVLASPGVLRRCRRAAKGRCVACGYDLTGGRGVCPECGHVG